MMDILISSKSRPQVGAILAMIATVFYVASLALVAGGDTNTPVVKVPEVKPAEPKTGKKPAKSKVTGAELYAINCNRCHAERYATEFTPTQWKTLMTHMRARANIPAAQAKLILKFLQEDSGN